MFKREVPTFNMRGKTRIASVTGAFLSFVILFIMLLYGIVKYYQLHTRSNPNVSTFVSHNYFDGTNVVNFKEQGLRFAFGIEG